MSKDWLLVFLGGGIGSVLRYMLSLWVPKFCNLGNFPLTTLLVNILGCFFIGIFFSVFKENSTMKWLLITGVCGGFTTFSAFSLDNIQQLQNGNYLASILYILGSVFFGIGATFLGILVVKIFF